METFFISLYKFIFKNENLQRFRHSKSSKNSWNWKKLHQAYQRNGRLITTKATCCFSQSMEQFDIQSKNN